MGQHLPTRPSTLQLRQFPTPTSTSRTPVRPHRHHTGHAHPTATFATLQTLQWTQYSISHWERYKQQITNTFFQWLKHHGMPVQNTDHITNKLHKFLQQQWHQHKQYLATHTFFHVPEVFELKRIITDQFIIHHADHETARPRIFCPHLYLKAASTTWGDPKLFTPLPDSPSEANNNLLQTIPTWLAQKYKWGINTQSTLPQGFVFLKQKKQWAKGRTIISYRNSTLARLLKAVAIALDTMVRQTWPSAPGNASTPELWQALHNYMHTTSTSIHLNMLNDDLVGFFNSVPHAKLQHSLHILIHQWRQKHNQEPITLTLHGHLAPSTPSTLDPSAPASALPITKSSTSNTYLTLYTSASNSASSKPSDKHGNRSKAQASAIKSHPFLPTYPSHYTKSIGNKLSNNNWTTSKQHTDRTSSFAMWTTA